MICRSVLFLAFISFAATAPAQVKIKVIEDGFNARASDIRAVCKSAGDQLLQHMVDLKPLTIEISKGDGTPISLFKRGENGQVRVVLTARKLFWAQYAYQFSHEICHVLCRFENDYRGNLWFEETLCETASLYCLRRMAEVWRTSAPYKSWQGFAPHLRSYTDSIGLKRKDYPELLRTGSRAYYFKHARYLIHNATDREKNGAFAQALLTLFERTPEHWNAIQYLNSTPSPKGETFPRYLAKWHNAAPEKHQEFIVSIARMFGIKMPGIED